MRILTSKVRFPRAAQISVTSGCSKMQILANCSSVAVSDLSSHFFLNHEVAPVHQAATGQGVFRFQRGSVHKCKDLTSPVVPPFERRDFVSTVFFYFRRADSNRVATCRLHRTGACFQNVAQGLFPHVGKFNHKWDAGSFEDLGCSVAQPFDQSWDKEDSIAILV
jgi:hypothetical protein